MKQFLKIILKLKTKITLADVVNIDTFDNCMQRLKYNRIGAGDFRYTYLSPRKDHVLKYEYDIPVGIRTSRQCNYIEAEKYSRFIASGGESKPNRIQYAPCEIVSDRILIMEAVTPVRHHYLKNKLVGTNLEGKVVALPRWVENNETDNGQVGWTKSGKLVCYDYAVCPYT